MTETRRLRAALDEILLALQVRGPYVFAATYDTETTADEQAEGQR